MGVSSKTTSRKAFQSITLPCRSHPSTDRIDKVLNKVKTWESTSTSTSSSSNLSGEIICSGLSQLTELFECLDDLVKTSLLQTSFSLSIQNTKWTDELLDVSVKFLDICGNATDVMAQAKENLRDLESDLRRKGESTTESIIAKFMVFRNKLRNDIKGSVASLKRVENMICACPLVADSRNHHLISVIRVFREVKALTIIILGLLLEFLATPHLKTKSIGRRWAGISRFMSNSKVVPEEKADTNVNELQCLDAALFRYSESDKREFIQIVQKKLQAADATLEGLNSHLEAMSRRLIATRASVLNMVSFY